MTGKFRENLHLCFSKLRRSPSKSPHSSPLLPTKPRAPISSPPRHCSSPSSALIVKSYNSLYDPASDASKPFTSSSAATSSLDSDSPESPDLASAYASRRFFFSYPGRSKSIVDELPAPPRPSAASVAVPKMSPDPFMDFRRSMEEMIASRGLKCVREDWDDLRELLLSYLALNRRHTHKYILGAFADLLVGLLAAEDGGDGPSRRGGS
ncbi:hypothetical protein H6P81_004895 [Aristolochia fimbriata]|uniref:Transcription repressor n=1 Tax=Aristolochia fimbriata TaxID=158543 RepID=A0AAV7EVW5_ARIFI|nr:hypothetical protein H6P81_004895 [Aristolochia fimbriata]